MSATTTAASTAPVAAAAGPADLQAANAAHEAAAAVAAAAAADATAAAGEAGVVLCRQHARIAVWAKHRSIAAEPRLDEYEARCHATQHARWAVRAAGLHDARRAKFGRHDALLAEDLDAVQSFCAAAQNPLDLSLRQEARNYSWISDEVERF